MPGLSRPFGSTLAALPLFAVETVALIRTFLAPFFLNSLMVLPETPRTFSLKVTLMTDVGLRVLGVTETTFGGTESTLKLRSTLSASA